MGLQFAVSVDVDFGVKAARQSGHAPESRVCFSYEADGLRNILQTTCRVDSSLRGLPRLACHAPGQRGKHTLGHLTRVGPTVHRTPTNTFLLAMIRTLRWRRLLADLRSSWRTSTSTSPGTNRHNSLWSPVQEGCIRAMVSVAPLRAL